MKNRENTFILSPFYELPITEEFIDNGGIKDDHPESVRGLLSEESYLLYQVNKDRLYIINPTTRYFLSLFDVERTPKEIVELIAAEGNCQPEDVAPSIEKFANSMLERNILVPFSKLEEILEFKEKLDHKKPMLKIGQFVNGYIIKEELAMRGKLELYIADRPNELGECVLKVLYIPDEIKGKRRTKAKKGFFQEFTFMKELNGHDGVCQLYDIIDNDKVSMAAMERIHGVSIRSWMKDQDVAPGMEERLHVMVQVADAIAWAQTKGIFHGDIHSGNFLVHDGNVKLIDFDLANREAPNEDEILRKGGVYEYIAPECLRTSSFGWLKRSASHSSEVYQLGVILYFILYSKFPFRAITWAGLADKILHASPIFDTHNAQGVVIPPRLLSICRKCLRKNPDDRYHSAVTLHKQLQKLEREIYSSQTFLP